MLNQDSINRVNEQNKNDLIATRDSIRIGKPFRGGIIFSIDGTGMSGLMAYPQDLPETLNWEDASARCSGLGNG